MGWSLSGHHLFLHSAHPPSVRSGAAPLESWRGWWALCLPHLGRSSPLWSWASHIVPIYRGEDRVVKGREVVCVHLSFSFFLGGWHVCKIHRPHWCSVNILFCMALLALSFWNLSKHTWRSNYFFTDDVVWLFTQLRREERRGEEIIEHKMHIDMDLFIEKDKKTDDTHSHSLLCSCVWSWS